VTGTTLATLGDQEVGKNTTPSDFSRVFNLLDTSGKTGFCKLETLS